MWGERVRGIREEVLELEQEQNLLKNKIMEQMGSAVYFEGPFGRFSWSEVKGRSVIDWKEIVKDFSIPEDAIKLRTKVGEPTRRFNPPRRNKQ